MGIGMIALGLWLLLGLHIHFQSILLFSTMVCLIIIFIGLCTISKYISYQYIKKSFITFGAYFIWNLLSIDLFLIEVALLCIFLFSLFNDIEQCALDYDYLDRYHKVYRRYLVFFILNFIFQFFNLTQFTFFLYIDLFLIILSLIYLCFILRDLIKINTYLEEKYRIEQISFSKTYKIYLLIFLACCSISGLILVKEPYEKTVQEEVIVQKEYYFKIDKMDYKLLPFGYSIQQKTYLTFDQTTTHYYPIRIFIHKDLMTSCHKIRYTFSYKNKILLSHEKDYEPQDLLSSYNRLYPEYMENHLTFDIYEELPLLHLEQYPNLDFKLELLDEQESIYYCDETTIQKVQPKSYTFKNDQIEITSLKYDMSVFLNCPKIQLRSSNSDIKVISIFESTQDIETENPIYCYDVEEDQFLLIANNYFTKNPMSDLLKIRIVCYDKDYQIILNTLCSLEEES